MNEHEKILNAYSSDYYFIYSSFERETWGNMKNAEAFIKRFELSENEYESKWRNIQKKIFDPAARHFPDLMFLENFEIFPAIGGVTLIVDEYEKIKKLMKEASDRYLVIIQNKIEAEDNELLPNLRMKFPVSATWEDLMSGGFISTVLFETPHSEYFIFGDSGNWGKYIDNDYDLPLDLTGVKNDFVDIFNKINKTPEDIPEELISLLPDTYKKRYKIHF